LQIDQKGVAFFFILQQLTNSVNHQSHQLATLQLDQKGVAFSLILQWSTKVMTSNDSSLLNVVALFT